MASTASEAGLPALGGDGGRRRGSDAPGSGQLLGGKDGEGGGGGDGGRAYLDDDNDKYSKQRQPLNVAFFALGVSAATRRRNGAGQNTFRALALASGLATCLLFCVLLAMVASWSSWTFRHAVRGRLLPQKNYCDSTEHVGAWVPSSPEYPSWRYLLNQTAPEASAAEIEPPLKSTRAASRLAACKHKYYYGREMLETYIRSGLRVEVWGDSAARQVVGSLMCWLTGAKSWKGHETRVPFLPRPRPLLVPHSGGDETDRRLYWSGADKCFNGCPEARLKACTEMYGTRQAGDAERLDECRYERLEFSWHVPRELILPLDEGAEEPDTPFAVWIPPTVTFRWSGKVEQIKRRVDGWLRDHPNEVYGADLLILSAGQRLPGDSTDAEFERVLQDTLQTINDNDRAFKNTDIVWLESNAVPPLVRKEMRLGEPDPDVRRTAGVRLAADHGFPVIRTYHMTQSSAFWANATDLHFPQLSEHRAQLVINYITHHF